MRRGLEKCQQRGGGGIVSGNADIALADDFHARAGAEGVGDLRGLIVAMAQHGAGEAAAQRLDFPEQFRTRFPCRINHVVVSAGNFDHRGAAGALRVRADVFLPVPALHGSRQTIQLREPVLRAAEPVHLTDDGRAAALGAGERADLDGRAVELLNLTKERGVRAAPGEDALLLIADGEERACAFLILDGFVAEIVEHAPLHAAGVLEFIEQPVGVAGIEAVINFLTRSDGEVAAENHLHILKRQPALPPDHVVIMPVVE